MFGIRSLGSVPSPSRFVLHLLLRILTSSPMSKRRRRGQPSPRPTKHDSSPPSTSASEPADPSNSDQTIAVVIELSDDNESQPPDPALVTEVEPLYHIVRELGLRLTMKLTNPCCRNSWIYSPFRLPKPDRPPPTFHPYTRTLHPGPLLPLEDQPELRQALMQKGNFTLDLALEEPPPKSLGKRPRRNGAKICVENYFYSEHTDVAEVDGPTSGSSKKKKSGQNKASEKDSDLYSIVESDLPPSCQIETICCPECFLFVKVINFSKHIWDHLWVRLTAPSADTTNNLCYHCYRNFPSRDALTEHFGLVSFLFPLIR